MQPGAGAQPDPGPVDGGTGQVHVLSLPPEAAAAGTARRWLRQVLTDAGREQWVDPAELACTELVGNAVLHAHTPVDVTVRVSADELLVEVHDRSPMMPVQRSYDSLSTTGRGMGLVAALVSEHGIRDAGPDGKTAWFVLRGHGGPGGTEDPLAAWQDAAWDDSAWDEATRDAVTSLVEPGPSTRPVVVVRLLGIPPTLWFAAREHHDTILRELALHLAEHPAAGADLAAADLARGTVSTALWALVDAHRPQQAAAGDVDDVVPPVLEPIDLEVAVPVPAVEAFARLQDTLDLAERLAAGGQLFTHPALPEVVAVRDWACEQVLSQHAGDAPVRWAGADQDVFVADGPPVPPEPAWDLAHVRDSARAVAAADDSNRIVAVSRPLAGLLGWEAADLVGRRVVTLVPHRFREAHVAGFTRHLATGETTIIDAPALLPVLAADGSEVLCRLLVEKAPGTSRGGRFLAWFEAQPGTGAPSA